MIIDIKILYFIYMDNTKLKNTYFTNQETKYKPTL